jgi:hypothetical protein
MAISYEWELQCEVYKDFETQPTHRVVRDPLMKDATTVIRQLRRERSELQAEKAKLQKDLREAREVIRCARYHQKENGETWPHWLLKLSIEATDGKQEEK